MIIAINSEVRISSDIQSWMLQKPLKRKRRGVFVEEWESFKWYTTLEKAVNGCADYMLMTSESKTLADALDNQKQMLAELCRALQPNYIVQVASDTQELKGLVEKEASNDGR